MICLVLAPTERVHGAAHHQGERLRELAHQAPVEEALTISAAHDLPQAGAEYARRDECINGPVPPS